ncbi:hypothetical protein ON010_g6854 [Phytophthora cinnamomi]|nr:hypothetical protein ON010_g6854 [Phytophthora cinnamomi]
MIPAGVRLDLFNSTAKLPDEVVIPLVKARAAELNESPYESRVSGSPTESMSIQPRLVAEFVLSRRQPSSDTHELCVRRTKDWIPTVVCGSRNIPTTVLLTNGSENLVWCPAHFSVVLWMLHGELPPDDGFVRLNSVKYRDWQVLAYETAIDKSLLRKDSACTTTGWPDNHLQWKRNQDEDIWLRHSLQSTGAWNARLAGRANASPGAMAMSAQNAGKIEVNDDSLADGPTRICAYALPQQWSHEGIMIASGNALPPPAYWPICHIDSPWASPIVIVLKKNGVDIRLCIDYKMVNAMTVLMEYAMPLVDGVLTELESYLWFCSLDTASGFWAPRGGWNAHAERVRRAEAATTTQRQHRSSVNWGQSSRSLSSMPKFEADLQASAESDPLQDLINGPNGDMFSTGESDTSALTPVFQRRSFVDDICFGGTTFDKCLETLNRLLTRFAECSISISFIKSIFVQPAVDFLYHEVSLRGIRAILAKMAGIDGLAFPKSKKGMQAFLGALNYYNRFIQNMAVYETASYQLTDTDFSEGGDLIAAESAVAELK